MTEQPTGDYRLIPWAYPPIPGGATGGGGGGNQPLNISRIESFDMGANIGQGANSTYVISLVLRLKYYEVLDLSDVANVIATFNPKTLVKNGTDLTQYWASSTRTLDPSVFESDYVQIGSSYEGVPMTSIPGIVTGKLDKYDYKWYVDLYDSSGMVIQTISGEITGGTT